VTATSSRDDADAAGPRLLSDTRRYVTHVLLK
jgi:hypothetical protein